MAFAIPNQQGPGTGDPNSMRNPYLDEIDAAANNAHAQLSPGAQEALRRAGAPVPQAQPEAVPQRITSPGPTPAPISMPQAAPAMPLPGGVRGNAANHFNTALSPGEEPQFQNWKAQYAPKDSGEDYDLRGAYKYGLTPSPENGHWSDKFKKPNEPTFSNESQYAQDAPDKAGHWNGDTYVPPAAAPQITSPNKANAPAPVKPVPLSPAGQGEAAELERITAPPPSDPALIHTHENTGASGIQQIHSPWARIPLQIAEAIGSGFAPGLTAAIPGTQLHHNELVGERAGALKQQETQREEEEKAGTAAATQHHLEAEAANQESLPEMHAAQAEAKTAQQKEAETHNRATEALGQAKVENQEAIATSNRKAKLAAAGFKEDNETGAIVPLEYNEMSETQQAVHDMKAAQSEQAEATAQLRKAQAANQPQVAAIAQARLANSQRIQQIAIRRLGLSEAQFEMRSQGTKNGVPLEGAIETDEGKPVGTAFQQNVRPTGQERNRADLATSAHQQLSDLKSIVQKRQDIFGPAAGRKTDFDVWLGSQDPDAQRFRAARTIAGDHLAGVFGGRSEAALQALDSAIGQFKDNPKAVLAGLDQLDKANSGFIQKGSPRTVGSEAAKEPPAANVDPKVKAYADQYFGGDVNKAQSAIDEQRRKK